MPPAYGPGSAPPPPWHVVGLPQQTKPLTRFSIVELDGRRVLRVESDHGYGNLLHPLKDMRPGTLAWRWRVDLEPDHADLHLRSGDDTALKVCALFDLPMERVPFVERQLLRFASARAGQPLPTATLCYVWDRHLPSGTVLHNAFTHRLRMIVSAGPLGRWTEERHDLAADFMRVFGDDTDEVPPLTAIAVGADADNTASRTLAYVDALQLAPVR